MPRPVRASVHASGSCYSLVLIPFSLHLSPRPPRTQNGFAPCDRRYQPPCSPPLAALSGSNAQTDAARAGRCHTSHSSSDAVAPAALSTWRASRASSGAVAAAPAALSSSNRRSSLAMRQSRTPRLRDIPACSIKLRQRDPHDGCDRSRQAAPPRQLQFHTAPVELAARAQEYRAARLSVCPQPAQQPTLALPVSYHTTRSV